MSTYDHINVYADGTHSKVEYSPGTDGFPVTVTITKFDANGNIIGSPQKTYVVGKQGLEMHNGTASKIYHQNGYWGSDCFVAGTPILLPSGAYTPIERVHEGLEGIRPMRTPHS